MVTDPRAWRGMPFELTLWNTTNELVQCLLSYLDLNKMWGWLWFPCELRVSSYLFLIHYFRALDINLVDVGKLETIFISFLISEVIYFIAILILSSLYHLIIWSDNSTIKITSPHDKTISGKWILILYICSLRISYLQT